MRCWLAGSWSPTTGVTSGLQGVPRDTVVRSLAHVPLGWRPTILAVRVRRYRCGGCGHVWRQNTDAAAAPRVKLSRHAVLWGVEVGGGRPALDRTGRGQPRRVVAHRQRRRPLRLAGKSPVNVSTVSRAVRPTRTERRWRRPRCRNPIYCPTGDDDDQDCSTGPAATSRGWWRQDASEQGRCFSSSPAP